MDQVTVMKIQCQHLRTTSTFAFGAHRSDCKEPLVSLFSGISRQTAAGEIIYALKQKSENN